MTAIAWNGIGLAVPDTWEPAGLERDSLLLESGDRPVCELKWNVVRGTFSFDKHLKRLAKGHKGVEVRGVAPEETPDLWSEAVRELERTGLRAQSFMWRSPHLGIGVALHNPGTGLASLVQFFITAEPDEDQAARVLASFRDHTGGKTIPWSLFGLAGRVPAGFRLETFSFKPGRHTVRYWLPRSPRRQERLPEGKGPGIHLTFERIVPARVLLKGTDLPSWTHDTLEVPPKGLVPEVSDGVVAWAGVARTSLLRKLLRRERHARGRVWTTERGNAILAVIAEGTMPLDEATFDGMVRDYGLV